MKSLILWFGLSACVVAHPSESVMADLVLLSKGSDAKVRLKERKVPVFLHKTSMGEQPVVILEGALKRKGASLEARNRAVPLDEKSAFRVSVPLSDEITLEEWRLTDAQGKTTSQVIEITVPTWANLDRGTLPRVSSVSAVDDAIESHDENR